MPTAATWMQPKVSVLGEVSQKEKDKYCMMWSLKYGTHEPIYKTDSQTGQTCSCQGRGGCRTGGMGFAGTTIMCRMDTPQGPTRNSTQCPVINHNGKGYLKKNVCICSETHFALQQIQD